MEYTETLLTLPEAASAARRGQMLLLLDHEDECPAVWLCLPAQFARADTLAQFAQIVAPVSPVLVASGQRPEILAEQFARFEHIPALHAHPGGLLKRRGFAEAALDLLRIAGLEPAALVARVKHEALPEAGGAVSFEDIIRYRKERRTSQVTQISLPTPLATFRLRHFQEIETGLPYLALTLGEITARQPETEMQNSPPPLVRLHSACATGDLFGSQRCDCQAQMHNSLAMIAQEERGVFLYLPQEGRGIGLAAKLQAYALQEQGHDTLDANELLGYPVDAREYGCAIEILRELGITHARLLTNNPHKLDTLREHGIAVERVPLEIAPTDSNLRYLQTKLTRMGHLLSV